MRAYLAYPFSEVEIMRMVALDADSAIEEQRIVLALTSVSFWFIGSADAASLAGEGSMVVEGSFLANCAFLTVEERLVLGTEDALVKIEVVDCMLRARSAYFRLKIEVFRKVALNALNLSEEGFGGWTFTDVSFLDVVATTAAFLAIFDGDIEVKPNGARLASIRCEDRLVSRATHAGLQIRVIEMILLASFADLVLVVEVFGQVATNTGLIVLEGSCGWANAALERSVVLLAFFAI